MTKEEEHFISVSEKIQGAEHSQMFGKPCFKINRKAFVCFYMNEMVFKLTGEFHEEAMSLDGSQLFDPSKKNRPMKEWVQVPYHYSDLWDKFALEASKYVGEK